MKKTIFKLVSLTLLVAVVLGSFVGCSKSVDTAGKKSDKKIVVGSKTFTENIVLGKILVKYLEKNGYTVTDETGLGETAIMRKAITSGEVDAYWEYTGTGVAEFMKHAPVFNAEESYKLIKEWDAKNKIAWLDLTKANNTYCIAVTKEIASKYNLKTISDLAAAYNKGNHIKFVTAPEYFEREDGMPHLRNIYKFDVEKKDTLLLDLGLFYDALKNKQGDVTTGFSTDGKIKAYDLVVLEDDKKAFATYNIVPVFRQEIIDTYPELPDQIKKITSVLDNNTVMELNSKVDVEGKEIDKVAEEFVNNLK